MALACRTDHLLDGVPAGSKEVLPLLSPKSSSNTLKVLEGHEQYHSLSHLGGGSYGQIFTATDRLNGNRVIIKKMPKNRVDSRIEAEAEAGMILRNVDGIQHFHRQFDTANHSCLVFDFVKGWDFFAYLESRQFKPLNEKLGKSITKQLVRTLLSCHRKGIAHKDLKLENIVVHPDGKTVTIIDFGLSSLVEPDSPCIDFSGSKEYCPPELLLRKPFDPFRADVWSLGVTMYCILFGRLPFDVKKDHAILTTTGVHPRVQFPTQSMFGDSVSDNAKNLIEKMLESDPSKRLSMQEVEKHAWFHKRFSIAGFSL
eukprot:TRINITY_DN894_c0_g1_i1.p1 TRINITY_DN894_c0_g1~~TRINITY_DN894_c0_g1_i1.p1  ORF type:complete len:313 (-),score=52.65 TRINITY_DN894_c0_g1_i1:213-1151(-)